MKAKNTTAHTTIDNEEIARFSRIADEWWSETGKFSPLHQMNPLRIQYISDKITEHFGQVAGLRLLDIGCGGGLIAEPMTRLGAKVTAIDAGEKNIAIAKIHAEKMGLAIDYHCTTVEDMAKDMQVQTFDVILALEIIEHVADLELFINASCKLLKPNGIIIFSTMNRTAKSYSFAIIAAEYMLRWLPIGTHNWKKFLRPSELCNLLENNEIIIKELMGMTYNPLTKKWRLDDRDLSVNYAVVGQKVLEWDNRGGSK
jgi:2-polyprenyl-6-hydroxyphenyl methylase/3-demethylubiquinone-9 3-methyltransferase